MTPKKWEKVKTKLLLFFILGSLGISISFLFSSCGSGPALKTLLSNLGVYAVDFDKVPNPWPADASVVIGKYDGLRYTAIKDHTSGATSVVIGDIDGNDYYCIKTHKATSSNRPTSGGSWATYWAATGTAGLGDTWVSFATSGTRYRPGNNEPFVGPNWQDYWVQQGSGGSTWADGRLYYIGDVGSIGLGKSIPRLADMTEFTIEARVKSATSTPASILQGGIFSRADDNYGCVLFVSDDAKFIMKPRATTSAAYLVSSGVALDNSTGWTHVAGVLANEDHSTVHADCTGNVAEGTSIAIGNSSDNLHISYHDRTNRDLKYATCPSTSDCTDSANWSIARLDIAGGPSSIALDSSDNLHISYYDSSEDGRDLKYTTCPSSGNCAQNISPPPDWSNILMEGFGNLGSQSSIAIDLSGSPPSNKIHIAYYLSEVKDCNAVPADTPCDSGDLKYATCDPSTSDCTQKANWTLTTVDDPLKVRVDGPCAEFGGTAGDATNAGNYPSIAIDSSNNLHISYTGDEQYGGSTGIELVGADLKYATCPGTSDCTQSANWTPITVDSADIAGLWTSIAIDSSNKVHISYTRQIAWNDKRLKYATNASGSWVVTALEGSNNVGDFTSIALDSSDNVYISYQDWDNNDLKYATNASGPWLYTTVDNNGAVGQYTSIGIDSVAAGENLHISYYDSTNGNLKYATCDPAAGNNYCTSGGWSIATLDDGDASGERPHIDIYVNGEFKACGTAFTFGSVDETRPTCTGGTETISYESNEQIGRSQIAWSGMNISAGTRLQGVIDEVRFWKEARTAGQIKTWMYKDITVENWNQANPNNALIGYWKFNEGSGAAIHDFSGSQNAGSKSYCEFFDRNGDGDVEDVVYSDAPANTIVDCYQSDVNCGGKTGVCSSVLWEGGWVAGYPF